MKPPIGIEMRDGLIFVELGFMAAYNQRLRRHRIELVAFSLAALVAGLIYCYALTP